MFDTLANGFTDLLRRGVKRFERHDEREFLPAAMEVLETPPSPTGRIMAITIGLFFTIALIWSFLGKVDIQATAPGRLLPSGKVKVIQPLDPGIVREILVQDGDQVRAGQLLIRLDPTQAGADRTSVEHDLQLAQLDVARLNALKHMAETGGGPGVFVVPAGANPDDIAEAKAALRAQVDQLAAKLAGLDQQIGEKHAEGAEVTATIDKLNASMPLLTQKEQLHKKLHDEGYGTSFSYLDAEQDLSDARRDLGVEAARGEQAKDSAASLERQKAEAVSEFNAGILADLAKAEEKQNELTQSLVKAQQKSAETELRAPIDGVVEELAAHTVGGVVTPAQRLMIIVPENQQLQVEAQLANRDVGFVHPGQDASVKIETYSFTRYGLIHGKVMAVSRDAIAAAERAADEGESAASQPQSAAQQASPTYVARISLDRSSMMIDGQMRTLLPGMAVTAEIRTGRRTIIDYLLSPLARKTAESLHER